jgi:hypothetical protein
MKILKIHPQKYDTLAKLQKFSVMPSPIQPQNKKDWFECLYYLGYTVPNNSYRFCADLLMGGYV